MDSRTLLELHPAVFTGKTPLGSTDLPWCESQPSREVSSLPLVVGADDGLVWAKADEGAGGCIREVTSPDEADAGFCFLALGRKNYLGLVSLRSGILVNGAPSLSLCRLDDQGLDPLAAGSSGVCHDSGESVRGKASGRSAGNEVPLLRHPD